MIQQGKVISVDGDFARVEIIRSSACSSCHNKDSCTAGIVSGCGKSERVEINAKNTCCAVPGDNVEITSDSGRALFTAFCVFVLPLILAFVSYFIAEGCVKNTVLHYVISGAVFLISFFGLFFGFDRGVLGKIKVEITSVVEKN